MTFIGEQDIEQVVSALSDGGAVLLLVRDTRQLDRCLRLLLASQTYQGARMQGVRETLFAWSVWFAQIFTASTLP